MREVTSGPSEIEILTRPVEGIRGHLRFQGYGSVANPGQLYGPERSDHGQSPRHHLGGQSSPERLGLHGEPVVDLQVFHRGRARFHLSARA